MRVLDLIVKKRDGKELTAEEINFLVQGYTRGEIPDYQMAAFLMAVYLKGLDFPETRALTRAFVNSGEVIDLREIPGIKVDKHSTGGVGDKTTLVLVPLVAAAGVTVVKMSGRALGHTGGTLDKLESIPGFRVDLDLEEIKKVVRRVGAVLVGQTPNLVPADKKIYALRDVTGTVDCLPLIASSVMSKKMAGGADRIVLDVKVGSGGFLPAVDEARALARLMVALGEEFNRRTVAVLSSMEQPLGFAVGNGPEVREAILTLKGEGPRDLVELCLELGSQMLYAAEAVSSPEAGREKLESLWRQGAGLVKMREIITAQGGEPEVVEDLSLLPRASREVEIKAPTGGYVSAINARELGWAALLLGAGRMKKEDQVDPAVGIALKKKVGDYVALGEALAVLHVNKEEHLPEARNRVAKAFLLGSDPPPFSPQIYEVIS
ncbi:MAG: pyrimidine-nucleoside phosphorylase [Bacillota bacterium]|nr:pyrimidine-nucleoside phosphorylase [Bacillota bacterium]